MSECFKSTMRTTSWRRRRGGAREKLYLREVRVLVLRGASSSYRVSRRLACLKAVSVTIPPRKEEEEEEEGACTGRLPCFDPSRLARCMAGFRPTALVVLHAGGRPEGFLLLLLLALVLSPISFLLFLVLANEGG